MVEAMRQVLQTIKGAYGLAVLHADEPEKLLAARCGSPLVIGLGKGENIIASDVSAILKHTKKVIYLNDQEIAVVDKKNVKVFDLDANEKSHNVQTVEWEAEQAEKQGYPHFMLKEIFNKTNRSLIVFADE